MPGNRVPCKIFVNRLRVITENNVATCLARASRICSSPAPGETRGAATLCAQGDARIPTRIKRKFTTCIFMEISICPARERDFRSRSSSPKRSRTARARSQQESTRCPSVYLARPQSYYANPVNGSAVSATRIKDIDAVARPEYVIRLRDPSVRPDTRAYLRGLLPVAGSIARVLPAA